MKTRPAPAAFLATPMLALGLHAAHAQAPQLPASQAYFMIVNQNSGSCVDLANGNAADGAVVSQFAYDASSHHERWALVPVAGGSHFGIVSYSSGKALTVQGDSTAQNAPVVDSAYNNDPSQQWDLVNQHSGWFSLRNVRSGKVLGIAGASKSDNAACQQYTSTGSSSQKFYFQPWGDYYIRSVAGNRYITTQNQGTTNNSPVVQYDKQSAHSYQWVFNNENNGYFSVSDQNAPTEVISVDNTATAAGAGTQLYGYNPNNAGDQEVRIVPKTDGKYKFYYKHDDDAWSIPGTSPGNNAPLQQDADNGALNQEFALERDASNVSIGFVSNSVYSIPAASVPAPTGSGVVSLRFLNGTAGGYRSSQLYWGILAQDPANNYQWSYVDAAGAVHPISAALNNAPGHLTKNGQNYANIYTSFDKTGWVNLPKLISARLYIGEGTACYITTYDNGFAGPNVDNPTDPNVSVCFDFTEFTIDSGGYHGNVTRVDGFGFPIQHRLVSLDNSYDQTVGELEAKTRSGIFNDFAKQVPSEFQDLATDQAPYRIVAPIHGSFNTSGKNANYFASTGFNTQDVLLGVNSASDPNTCAALNRGIYSNPSSTWGDSSTYYQSAPANYYAKFWHTEGINNLAYGFCYDDVDGQAAYLSLGNPKGLIIRVGR